MLRFPFHMLLLNSDRLSFYQFHLFQPFVQKIAHGIFGRINVNGDFTNRRTLIDALGGSRVPPIGVSQAHGTKVAIIKHTAHIEALSDETTEADALITALPGVPLLTKTADCQAILLLSSQGVIANIHAGWRGLVRGIIAETIRTMQQSFHVQPWTIFAGISSSLGPCCAEFQNREREFPPQFQKYFIPRHHVNLWWAAVDQLEHAGVPRDHIEVSGLCTACNTDKFFSYRKEKPDCGRSGNVIMLLPQSPL